MKNIVFNKFSIKPDLKYVTTQKQISTSKQNNRKSKHTSKGKMACVIKTIEDYDLEKGYSKDCEVTEYESDTDGQVYEFIFIPCPYESFHGGEYCKEHFKHHLEHVLEVLPNLRLELNNPHILDPPNEIRTPPK